MRQSKEMPLDRLNSCFFIRRVWALVWIQVQG